MAHKFENARALLTALDFPRQSAGGLTLQELTPRTESLDFEEIARSIYANFDRFAQLIAHKISVDISGETFDTSNIYQTPGCLMMVYSLKPAEDNTLLSSPPQQNVATLQILDRILDMYHKVDLTDQELAKIVIEKRPSSAGHTIEALVKSHGNTPVLITNTIKGATAIIGHPTGRPYEDYTTIKLSPLENEDSPMFVDRINQAIETTAAGIISKSLNHQAARQTLLAA